MPPIFASINIYQKKSKYSYALKQGNWFVEKRKVTYRATGEYREGHIYLEDNIRINVSTLEYPKIAIGDEVYVVLINRKSGKTEALEPIYPTKSYVYGDDIKNNRKKVNKSNQSK